MEITILMAAITIATKAWQAAKASGLIGDPEWTKYADAGLGVLVKGAAIASQIQEGSTDYDHLTADEIEALLKPATWDEIEAKAKAELGE